jgi:hypothetical protein
MHRTPICGLFNTLAGLTRPSTHAPNPKGSVYLWDPVSSSDRAAGALQPQIWWSRPRNWITSETWSAGRVGEPADSAMVRVTYLVTLRQRLSRILNATASSDPKAAVDDYLEHLAHEADTLIMQYRAGRVASMTEFESRVNRDLRPLRRRQARLRQASAGRLPRTWSGLEHFPAGVAALTSPSSQVRVRSRDRSSRKRTSLVGPPSCRAWEAHLSWHCFQAGGQHCAMVGL